MMRCPMCDNPNHQLDPCINYGLIDDEDDRPFDIWQFSASERKSIASGEDVALEDVPY